MNLTSVLIASVSVDIIKSLKSKDSHGYDEIFSKFLKISSP